jgi:hypothetical protein
MLEVDHKISEYRVSRGAGVWYLGILVIMWSMNVEKKNRRDGGKHISHRITSEL